MMELNSPLEVLDDSDKNADASTKRHVLLYLS